MKNKNENIKLIPIIIFSFVIGGVVMFALLKWTPIIDEVIGSSNSTVITKNGTQVYEKGSLAASVEKIYDAVAVVKGYTKDQLSSTGTGFVYKTDNKYGYILTNQHVISGQEKITLVMTNDEEVEAKVLGGDGYLDLAVLRIDKSKEEN